MQITINGEQERLEQEGLSVAKLLELKNVESPEMVSVQLNGRFIDRKDYPVTPVADNDTLDFLYFMGGGGC